MFAAPLTDHAELRPIEVWQTEEFAEHLDRAREHIRPWVGPSFLTYTLEAARDTIRRYGELRTADRGGLYGIWLDEDVLVGGVMFVAFDAPAGWCEIGCWLEPDAEGRGLISAACRLLIDWAIFDRGLNRVEWRCRVDNTRSSAVAARLGMTCEGVLRQAWLNDGVFHDKQVWSVLREEWLSASATRSEQVPPS